MFSNTQTMPAPYPSFAWIAVTNRCNLNCAHCQRGLLKERGMLKQREMSRRVFKRLEEEVFPHLERVQFGGNNFGEQLFASNWDEIFEKVSKYNMRISIITNATLLNRERIKAMVEAGVEFNCSLEGISKESYEAVRGYGFDKFIEVVKRTCREKIKRPESGARVHLGFTVFRDNIMEIADLVKISSGFGADRIIVTHFVPWQESQRLQSLVYHKELSDRMLQEAKEIAADLKIWIDLPVPFGTGNDKDKRDQLGIGRAKPCYHPWRSFSVNEKGDVMPCCATSVVMGNLERSSFKEIWNGSKYTRLRETVNSSNPLAFCRDCALRGIDMESKEPISLWSDEKVLLAGIGNEMHKNSTHFVLRRFKNRLIKTRWGGAMLPYMTEIYRERVAFYVIDIRDSWLTPLTRKRVRSNSIRDYRDN